MRPARGVLIEETDEEGSITARDSDRLDVRSACTDSHYDHLFRIGSTTLVERLERVKGIHPPL